MRRYDLPSARGLVRVEPRAQPVVVDGSAAGAGRPGRVRSAARRPAAAVLRRPRRRRSCAPSCAPAAQLVISDSNRRQAFVTGSLEQNAGPVLTPPQDVSADGLILDPFGRGPDDETVATYSGVRSVEAPSSPEVAQFPEHAPFAAIDGSPSTAWLADPTLGAGDRWLQVDFDRPRAVPSVRPAALRRPACVRCRSPAVRSPCIPGWNRLSLGLRGVVESARVADGRSSSGASGGISELRIPGVTATEALRLPVDATARAARHRPALHRPHLPVRAHHRRRPVPARPRPRARATCTSRATPSRRCGGCSTCRPPAGSPPAHGSRRSAQTPDDTLDRLAGYRGPVRATSSSRVDGEPRWRASMALDGDPGTAWIADWSAAAPPWLSVTLPVADAGLGAGRSHQRPMPVRRPTRVRVLWPGGSTPPLAVSAGGQVTLPQPVRARTFRLEVLDAAAPPGATRRRPPRRGHRRDRRAAAGARKRLSPLQRPLRHRPHPGRDGAGAAARLGLGPRVRGRHAAARPVVWEPRDARRRSPPPGGGARGARGRRPAPVLAGAGAGRRRGEHRVGDQSGHGGPRLL